jgi:hypothetical protein
MENNNNNNKVLLRSNSNSPKGNIILNASLLQNEKPVETYDKKTVISNFSEFHNFIKDSMFDTKVVEALEKELFNTE